MQKLHRFSENSDFLGLFALCNRLQRIVCKRWHYGIANDCSVAATDCKTLEAAKCETLRGLPNFQNSWLGQAAPSALVPLRA